MIGIRVDANNKTAMGHIMRCLAIAKQLYALGKKIIFLVSDEDAVGIIRDNRFEYQILPYAYNEKNKEVDVLISLLKQKKVNTLLIDSYEVTEEYMIRLKEKINIIYLYDLNMFKYAANLIINYTFGTKLSLYQKWNYDADTKFLLGSNYIPLGPGFVNIDRNYAQKIERVFITTGGTDKNDMLLGILHKLVKSEWSQIEKVVIAGKFYGRIQDLEKVAMQNPSVKVYYNISNMAEIMRQCDVAISAGGTTIAELCACGIPTIGFSVADNQVYGLEAYSKAGIIKYAGDVRDGKEIVIENIEDNLYMLTKDEKLREYQGILAHSIIDGKGALRIAKAIVSI